MDILAVSTEFQSVFDSVEGTLLTIAPIVGLLGSAAISKSFTWYKTYKVIYFQVFFKRSTLVYNSTKSDTKLSHSTKENYLTDFAVK